MGVQGYNHLWSLAKPTPTGSQLAWTSTSDNVISLHVVSDVLDAPTSTTALWTVASTCPATFAFLRPILTVHRPSGNNAGPGLPGSSLSGVTTNSSGLRFATILVVLLLTTVVVARHIMSHISRTLLQQWYTKAEIESGNDAYACLHVWLSWPIYGYIRPGLLSAHANLLMCHAYSSQIFHDRRDDWLSQSNPSFDPLRYIVDE